MRSARTAATLVVAALAMVSAGCTSTVGGSAVRAGGESPPLAAQLDGRDLDDILLDDGELSDLLGGTDIEVTDEGEEMTDDADDVSAPECVGALYSAEEPIYQDTGYTAVLTRLASEPDDDYEHWVEESAVVLPSAQAAEDFVETSAQQWDDCAGQTVSISDGENWYDWELGELSRVGAVLRQTSTAVDSVVWQCEHTLGAASNVVIEASVCAEQVDGEATTLIDEMIAKAAQR